MFGNVYFFYLHSVEKFELSCMFDAMMFINITNRHESVNRFVSLKKVFISSQKVLGIIKTCYATDLRISSQPTS